jgi:hypothetical protein
VVIKKYCQAPVAHTYNPSYSEGRDQEDHSMKPPWASSSQDPILKKPITKEVEWLKVKALNTNPSKAKRFFKKEITPPQKEQFRKIISL